MGSVYHVISLSRLVTGHERLLVEIEFVGVIKAQHFVFVIRKVGAKTESTVVSVDYSGIQAHFYTSVL